MPNPLRPALPSPALRALMAAAALSIAAGCGTTALEPDHFDSYVFQVTAGDNETQPLGTAIPVTAQLVFPGSPFSPFVPGAFVTWSVGSGGGTVEVKNATTDDSGNSHAVWTLGPQAGAQTLVATAYDSESPVEKGKGHGTGKAVTFTATAFSNAVASIEVKPDTTVRVGTTFPVRFTLRNARGDVLSGRNVNVFSGNSTLLRVDFGTGGASATAVAAGSADVVVQSEGKEGRAQITILPQPVASLTLSPTERTLAIGETVQLVPTTRDAQNNVLTGRPVTYASGNAAVATVDPSGLVRAVAAGEAVITATSEGKTATATIRVSAPASCVPGNVCTVTISTHNDRNSVQAGHTLLFQAILRDSDGNQITSGATVSYETSNEAVARVEAAPPGGPPGYFANIVGVSAGSVRVTAIANGVRGSRDITVTP